MEYFISEEGRNKLVNDLCEIGMPERLAKKVSEIPEGLEDAHMAAHAQACIEAVTNESFSKERQEVFLLSSSICLQAIGDEARRRRLGKDHFPIGSTIMDNFTALHRGSLNG